jgi:hypothetical protein
MASCGPSAGASMACKGVGQCCDETSWRCVTGPEACAAVPRRTTFQYDGPPTQTTWAAFEASDADAHAEGSTCGASADELSCGANVNALCPYRAGQPDLRCVELDPTVPLRGACRPAEQSDDHVLVWEGAWTRI